MPTVQRKQKTLGRKGSPRHHHSVDTRVFTPQKCLHSVTAPGSNVHLVCPISKNMLSE